MKNNILQTQTHNALPVIIAGFFSLAIAGSHAADTTNVFSFDTSSSANAWALPAWGGQGQGSAWDGTQDHTGNSGGSLYVLDNWSNGDQLVDLGWFSGSAWYNPGSAQIDLTLYTNVSFYVKWDTVTSTIPLSTFQTTGEQLQLWAVPQDNGSWIDIGSITIPGSASNGWVKVNVPINPTIPGINTAYGLGFKKYTGTGLTGIAAFWVDDITLEANNVSLPPPTMNLQKPISGLNLFAPTGPYNRENLKTLAAESWVGYGSTPVSYSFTIKHGVDGSSGAQFQNHIFIIPNPGTETAPDWNEPNVIFADLESTASGGAMWTFRYKTNQPNGNAMLYNTNIVPASIGNSTPDGTWTLTFVNDTNVTMTAPSGNSTNFVIPEAVAQMFADPAYVYFGVQANNASAIGQDSVLSEIKITGTANPIDDVFLNDLSIDTNNTWAVVANDPQGVILAPANSAFWVTWTVPDTGFSLTGSSNLLGAWNELTGVTPVQMGPLKWALLNTGSLPGQNNGFFRLIKRTFTQLQVLLPGETNAPDTQTGKMGTPDPVSLSANSGFVTVTINACDSTWHIVNVSGDTIHLTTTDGTAVTPLDAPLSNGTLQQTLQFGSQGTFTVTASDLTNTNILSNTSSSVTVGP